MRWMELQKDYDVTIFYHPRNANIVTDALSRKARSIEVGFLAACVEAISFLLEKIKGKQFDDEKLSRIRDMVLRREAKDNTLVYWSFEGIIKEGEIHLGEASRSSKQAEGACRSKGQGLGVYGERENVVEGFTHEGCDEVWYA
ncbi:hypothetical protein MTR67_002151, partial [Solanum verrucosum]